MGSGDVNRYRNTLSSLVKPFSLISCNVSQHVIVDNGNKSVVFEDRNKLGRCHKTQIRRIPSDKGFGTSEFVCARIVFRLIVNEEFPVLNGRHLSADNGIDPLLFINEFAVEESNSGISRLRDREFCRTSIVIQKIDIRDITLLAQSDLLLCGSDHVNARFKCQPVTGWDRYKRINDVLKSSSCFLLISYLKKKRQG